MALTSTLYTGLSGMTVNQQRLNVTGNNIANVNTVAFKSSRALIKPQFYVTDGAGSSPSADSGGVNPSQRGLGAQVASIQKNFSAGSIESTGVPTDMAIEGDGFFVVERAGETRYTRDGSFTLNENNELVSSSGEFVKGYGVDKDFQVTTGALQKLTVPVGSLTIAEATSNVTLKGNLNADGDVATGASVLESPPLLNADGTTPTDASLLTDLRDANSLAAPMFTDGQKLTMNGKRGGNALGDTEMTVGAGTTVADLNAFFQGALGIDTSADVLASAPAGFAPGAALATSTATADPAGSLRLSITGNAGDANSLNLSGDAFTTDGGTVPIVFADAANSAPAGESQHTTMTVYDSLGTPLQVDMTMALESKSNTGTVWRYYATSKDNAITADGITLGSGTVSFDNNGVYKAVTNDAVSISRDGSGAVDPLSIKMDFTKITSLTDQRSNFTFDSQDGFETGSISNFSVADNGDITGTFTNGLKRTLGQVAIATFDNQEGLIDTGSNDYMIGPGSGEAVIGEPGTFGAGLIRSGSLEQSNVDLSREFLNMIVSSTGFSASSRVITTSNQLLDQLLQTAR